MSAFLPYLKLMRPHQWVKSGFVFVGLFFGHAWHDAHIVHMVLLAAAAFSLAASGIYIINDLADRERDREHPEKRFRPLAAGTVGVKQALVLAGVCVLSALTLAWAASNSVLLVACVYILLNVAYSMGLKRIALLDVFIISSGFMLRIVAGTVGVGIEPSHWLLLCSLLLTLFLGFAKRRAEVNVMAGRGGHHRQVLDDYDPVLLDSLITICATGTIVSYSLYTVSPETVAIHGTANLIYTVPFVIYGTFRYLFLLHRRARGGDPAATLLQDYHLLGTFSAWFVTVMVLLR